MNKCRNFKVGLFFFILICLMNNLYSQTNSKYCFCGYTSLNGKKITPEKQVIETIKDKHNLFVNKTGEIWSICNVDSFRKDNGFIDVPIELDSFYVHCKIIKITKKNDNYILKEKRLVAFPIYVIDIELVGDDSVKNLSNMQIISIPQKRDQKHRNKIKEGQIYRLHLISYFETNCCRKMINNNVVELVKGPETMECFLLNNIWIVNMSLDYNLFKSNNLQGLYFSPEY